MCAYEAGHAMGGDCLVRRPNRVDHRIEGPGSRSPKPLPVPAERLFDRVAVG